MSTVRIHRKKNKSKIDPPHSKNLLLCCPNLDAVLLKYIATLQASKITLLWLSFHQWHHFSRPSHCPWGRWWRTDHEISRVTPITQEKWGKWSWRFRRRDGHEESNGDELDEQNFSERPVAEMEKNSLKILAQPKTRGKNMKTPFLSSFCQSDFRTVLRFPPKNLVPEMLNLLTLVVRNCSVADWW